MAYSLLLFQVSIIPRTSVKLGFAQYSPRERKILAKEEVFHHYQLSVKVTSNLWQKVVLIWA